MYLAGTSGMYLAGTSGMYLAGTSGMYLPGAADSYIIYNTYSQKIHCCLINIQVHKLNKKL